MELKQLLDENQIHELSDIKFDSRLLFAYMRDRKTGREYVDFTYKKFHREVVDHFTRLGDDADITYHTDQEFDKRSIPDYAILGRVEVVHFLSRRYKDVDTLLFKFIKRLEARVLEQQAELVRKDAIIAMLKYEFGESSLASAFVFGMQQEAQDRSFQFIDKPKLLLANLAGPMTACFNNGVDFYSEHKRKRLTGESVWDFYTRIKTEQALALL